MSKSLRDPIKYLVYKLSSNSNGVSLEKVLELFGGYGEKQLKLLLVEELIVFKNNTYRAKIKHFSLSNDLFIEHFKCLADFIKTQKHAGANKNYSPLFTNYSNTINKKAYSEILKIQRAANKKIALILADDRSAGTIPTFCLNAIDTIDTLCADEFSDQ